MKITVDGIMGRDLATRYAWGTWAVLPRVPSPGWDDSFCRVVHDTDDLHLDRIVHDRNRGNYEPYQAMADILELDCDFDKVSLPGLVEIVVTHHMLQAGTMIEHTLNRMLWDGNPVNNIGRYREFKGFNLRLVSGVDADIGEMGTLLADRLAGSLSDGIDYILAGHPVLLVKWLGEDIDSYEVNEHQLRLVWDYDMATRYKSDEVVLSLFAIPISQGNEPLTCIEYVDYRNIPIDGCFWTDEGQYVWALHQEKWDAKLSVKNESRLVVKRPELIMKVNVRFPKEEWI